MGSLGEPKNFIKLNMKQVRGMQPPGTVSGHGISHLHDLIHMQRYPDSTAKMKRENFLHPEDPVEPQWAKINREYIRDVNNAGYDPKSITHYPSTAGAKWDDRKPSKRHPSGLRAVLKDKQRPSDPSTYRVVH